MSSHEETPRIAIQASDVKFHEATPSQRTESWRLSSASWAGPLSIEDFIARGEHLSRTALCADGRTRYWVVTRISDSQDVVASCRTMQKSIHSGGPGGYRELNAYAIASVYTNPKYRRNGMAVLMLDEVKKWLDGEGAAECSALYSDIGKVSQIALFPTAASLIVAAGILCEVRLGRVSFSANHCSLQRYRFERHQFN